jgi:hypothetical protein
MRVGPKCTAGKMLGTQSSETLINGGLKISKHDKRASCIGDGYLTVRDFRVPVSLRPKVRQKHFFIKVDFEERHG